MIVSESESELDGFENNIQISKESETVYGAMADEFSNPQSTKLSSSQIIRPNYQNFVNGVPIKLVRKSNSEEIYKIWRQYIFLLYLFVFILYLAELT